MKDFEGKLLKIDWEIWLANFVKKHKDETEQEYREWLER